jgi:hypothetical protein
VQGIIKPCVFAVPMEMTVLILLTGKSLSLQILVVIHYLHLTNMIRQLLFLRLIRQRKLLQPIRELLGTLTFTSKIRKLLIAQSLPVHFTIQAVVELGLSVEQMKSLSV